MKTVAINNGYYQYKSMDKHMFKARIKKCLCNEAQSNCDILTIDEQSYIIGEGDFCIDNDKTSNENNKILILNMLAKFIDSDKEKETFNVYLCTPPSLYKNQSEALPSYLKGTYKIVANDKPIEITINNVQVFPESFIIYLNYQEKYKNKNLIIFDIGGHTTNIVLIKKGVFTNEDYITIGNGMYHIDDKICQYLNGKHLDTTFNIDDIQYLRDIGDNLLTAEEPELFKIYDDYVSELVNAMQLKQWNIKYYEKLCTGGGSKILYENMENVFDRIELSIEPLFDNVKALEKLASKKVKK